jgi:2-keto-4-pentenoate hydratase
MEVFPGRLAESVTMSDEDIISALHRARLSGSKMTRYPGPRPRDKAHAFEIQSAVRHKLRSWKHVGWKVGCTSEKAQKALKTDGPFPGPVYGHRLYKSGAYVSTQAANSRTTEPEIAFTMARDLPARGEPYSIAETLAAVKTVHPAIEVVNPRCPKGFDDEVEWYIADGALSHGLVLGTGIPPLPQDQYAGISAKASVNGEWKYSGVASNALGGPENVLTWLANDLVSKGLHLRAGDVVSTGVITEVFDANIGDEVMAVFEGLGVVSISY